MNIKTKIKENIDYIAIVLLIIPASCFLYFAAIPQYDIRDHEGYLGGAIVLAGYVALVLFTNLIKKQLLKGDDKAKSCLYILSIVNVISSLICIKTLLFYYARVYLLSLAVFWMIPFAYLVFRQLMIKTGKNVKLNYMSVLSLVGMAALLSTVVRGMYIFRWQVLLTLVVLCVLSAIYIVGTKTVDGTYFPYDFVYWKNELKADFTSKFKTAIVIVLSLVVLYLLLGPLEIYVGNMLAFSFGYKTFTPLFLLIGVLVLVFLPAFISLFTYKTFKLICVLLTAFSFLSYVQCMFMNTKLSEEDGARLRLDTMGNYPKINLILWVIIAVMVIAILYIVKDKWNLVAMGICGFIGAVQMVAVISLIITCMNSPAPRYYQLTGDKMFSVAKDENVIVLVPDSFARKYLDELIADDPTCLDLFKDFTYYSNMDSEYFPTFPSFIHFVTGYERIVDVGSHLSKERVQWQTDAWNSERCNSFFDETNKAGYDFYINIPAACELLGAYDDVCDKVENVEYAESNVDKMQLIKMLFSMSIYRSVPYVIKPPFEYFNWDFAELERYNGKVAAYRNEDFYKEVCDGITVDDTVERKIHIINWHGFHEEYTNDEYCNYLPNAESKGVTMLQNGKGVFLCIEQYLNALKSIDMYDSSTIIVMGDHGKFYDGCVFIKRPNETHKELIVDDEPRIYGDFQATILKLIENEKYEDFGTPWTE